MIRKTGRFIFISVKNLTRDYVEISDDMDTKKSDKKNHGFGLKNVKKAVTECGGTFHLDCTKECEKYIFTVEAVLPMDRVYNCHINNKRENLVKEITK